MRRKDAIRLAGKGTTLPWKRGKEQKLVRKEGPRGAEKLAELVSFLLSSVEMVGSLLSKLGMERTEKRCYWVKRPSSFLRFKSFFKSKVTQGFISSSRDVGL